VLTPRWRKATLTAHITASVGWLGGIACSLALGIVGLTSPDPPTVRAAYLALEATGWWVLVPFSVGSLATGLVQSLGTDWGLVRHYWVLAKLVINVFATAVLLLYTETLGHLAGLATDRSLTDARLLDMRTPSPAIHATAALLLLLLAVILSVFKPRGMTRYGLRRRRAMMR
jgi:hypothetical protein